jgi:hypothetical protein
LAFKLISVCFAVMGLPSLVVVAIISLRSTLPTVCCGSTEPSIFRQPLLAVKCGCCQHSTRREIPDNCCKPNKLCEPCGKSGVSSKGAPRRGTREIDNKESYSQDDPLRPLWRKYKEAEWRQAAYPRKRRKAVDGEESK